MAEEAPADASTANAAQLLCPRCDTLVLRQGAGRWATHEKLLPKTSVPPEGWPTPEDAVEALGEFWAVDVSSKPTPHGPPSQSFRHTKLRSPPRHRALL